MAELVRIESEGSIWYLDEEHHTYRRTPRREGPREEPYLSTSQGTPLEDLTEHPYRSWELHPPGSLWRDFDDNICRYDNPVVVIRFDGAQIIAPITFVEYLRLTDTDI